MMKNKHDNKTHVFSARIIITVAVAALFFVIYALTMFYSQKLNPLVVGAVMVVLFVAAVLLAATMMAPDAVSQFPDEFNATFGEKAGLAISRAVMAFTSALSDVNPVSDLASGRAITPGEVLRTAVLDLVLLPSVLLSLAAFLLRRKAK